MCKKIKTAEQIVKIAAGTNNYNQLLLVTPNSHVNSTEIWSSESMEGSEYETYGLLR
jgi:hypothetical protein